MSRYLPYFLTVNNCFVFGIRNMEAGKTWWPWITIFQNWTFVDCWRRASETINGPISQWCHNTPSAALHVKCVSFQNVNNLSNTEFPIRKITITTTFAVSSSLRPQIHAGLASISTIPYYNISPSYSSSVYSRGEYNTVKWRSESIVHGNSAHNCKKISILKISAEAYSLIFLLWKITCKKRNLLLQNKRHMRPAPHVLWHHGKSLYCETTFQAGFSPKIMKNYIITLTDRERCLQCVRERCLQCVSVDCTAIALLVNGTFYIIKVGTDM